MYNRCQPIFGAGEAHIFKLVLKKKKNTAKTDNFSATQAQLRQGSTDKHVLARTGNDATLWAFLNSISSNWS